MESSKLEDKLLEKILESGLETPEREYRFHPTRKFRFDFAWPTSKIAVEVEGGLRTQRVKCHKCGVLVMQRTKAGRFTPVFAGGRHNSAAGFENDAEKYNLAGNLGWLIVRVTRKMIVGGDAMMYIQGAFELKGKT